MIPGISTGGGGFSGSSGATGGNASGAIGNTSIGNVNYPPAPGMLTTPGNGAVWAIAAAAVAISAVFLLRKK